MKKFYQLLSFRQKLAFLSLFPGAIVAVIMAITIVFNHFLDQRQWHDNQTQALTCVIAQNISASVLFQNQQAAQEILDVLKFEPTIKFARAISSNGQFVSEFFADSTLSGVYRDFLDHPSQLSSWIPTRKIIICPILVQNESIGNFYVISETVILDASLKNFIVVTVLALITALVIIGILEGPIHYAFSKPILELKDGMNLVADKYRYDIRMPMHPDPDLQDLYRGFNHMLEQIELREQEIKNHQIVLNQLVEERTNELYKLRQKRLEWLENMSFFLRHELKNKIIGFQSTLDLIERKFESGDIEKYIERARKSTSFMHLLLKSVGDASDLETAVWSEAHDPLNLSNLIQEQLIGYHENYPQADFDVDLTPKVKVKGNAVRLIQMLDKLVSNAVEHACAGTHIHLKLEKQGHHAVISICNQGDALPEDIDTIFDLFSSTKRRLAGNYGIGLYLVKLIVENHSGEIKVYPFENNSGACFEVYLSLDE